MTTLGGDFVAFSGVLPCSISSVGVRFGGRGGSFAGSKTGAILLPVSIDGVREADVLAVPFERAEIEEILEVVEAMDSFESRLLKNSEGRLGGRAGEGCIEFLRGGNRGGGVGFGDWAIFWPVRVIVGGGRMPSLLGPLGSLPMPLPEDREVTAVDETLLRSSSGLPASSSRLVAVMGARPTCPRFRAAMRAWID